MVRGGSRTQDAEPRGSTVVQVSDISVTGEENLLEVLMQVENIWPHLEDIVEEETTKRRQRLVNNEGGSWPQNSCKSTMIHLIWNYRGLGSDTVVGALHGLIRKHRPSLVFLSETKMKNHIIVVSE